MSDLEKTTKKIVVADMWLNWIIGGTATFLPFQFSSWLSQDPILPAIVYVLIGVGFLLFAYWQWGLLRSGDKFLAKDLKFSAWLAIGPVVLLTIVLFLPIAAKLHLISRIVLWIADVYMLMLAGWYWWVAGKMTEK